MISSASNNQSHFSQSTIQNLINSNKQGGAGVGVGNGPRNGTNGMTSQGKEGGGSIASKEPEMIVIHVFDENRNINKDFQCEKDILIKNMKYFENYLTEATSVEDIDISVHCDIKIFEWLMRYLKFKDCKPGVSGGLDPKD